MVSKMAKRTPTKSLKNRKNRPNLHGHRRKSPVKNAAAAASVVVASINKSIYTCHRRLIKIFKKLARITTPKRSPSRKGYQVLGKVAAIQPENAARRSLFSEKISLPLPPSLSPGKKTIVLDLDETLVHSTASIPPEKYDFVVRPVLEGEKVSFYVLKRPFLDEFLSFLGEKFEIVVFTAGIEAYASLVLDKLDKRKLISHRLYRDSCKEIDGKFVKDLSRMGRELERVVIVDDNPNSYQFQPRNAIPIRPFTDNPEDDELKKLIPFIEGCEEAEDVREAVKKLIPSNLICSRF